MINSFMRSKESYSVNLFFHAVKTTAMVLLPVLLLKCRSETIECLWTRKTTSYMFIFKYLKLFKTFLNSFIHSMSVCVNCSCVIFNYKSLMSELVENHIVIVVSKFSHIKGQMMMTGFLRNSIGKLVAS